MKKIKSYSITVLTAVVVLTSCKNTSKKGEENLENVQKEVSIEENLKESAFDTIIDGKQVSLFWIKNDSIKVAFTNYGGRIVGVWIPNEKGEMTDVVVGMGSTKAYVNSTEPYFGATIGRVGNRIAKGKFTLNGNEYTIPLNNNGNTLHGGKKGFQYVVWDAEQPDEKTLVLKYRSPDMEEGFPGNLDVTVTYTVTEDRGINMKYEAITDKSTPVNLTNHAFFNLNGEGSGTILNHNVQLYAEKFTPVDQGLIPTGELKDVEGTPFDFRESHKIGERIEADNEQLKNGDGYDHNFVLNQTQDNGLNKVATITGDISGIRMDVFTEEPGVQFYSGNFMEGKNIFKSGVKDDYRTAFALETQHFPDAPNQADFPSIILEPGETYHTVSEYKFSTVKVNQ